MGYEEVRFLPSAGLMPMGMKDIIWYTPNRQADGSYTVTAKHSGPIENYGWQVRAQVFYVDAKGQNKSSRKPLLTTQLLNHLLI